MTKLINKNCEKTQKIKLWQKSKNQIVKNSESQIWTKLNNKKKEEKMVILPQHLNYWWNGFKADFCNLAMFLKIHQGSRISEGISILDEHDEESQTIIEQYMLRVYEPKHSKI